MGAEPRQRGVVDEAQRRGHFLLQQRMAPASRSVRSSVGSTAFHPGEELVGDR
jgi:hypothetical protein